MDLMAMVDYTNSPLTSFRECSIKSRYQALTSSLKHEPAVDHGRINVFFWSEPLLVFRWPSLDIT
jgi:hypothetical protein